MSGPFFTRTISSRAGRGGGGIGGGVYQVSSSWSSHVFPLELPRLDIFLSCYVPVHVYLLSNQPFKSFPWVSVLLSTVLWLLAVHGTLLVSWMSLTAWLVGFMAVLQNRSEPRFFGWSRSRFKIWDGAGADILGRLRLLFLASEKKMI